MKLRLLLTLFSALSFTAEAQNVDYKEGISYIYLDKEKNTLPSKENAAYVRTFEEKGMDGNVFDVREYTISGTLCSIVHSTTNEYLHLNGRAIWYNAKRKPLITGEYFNNTPTGKWTYYHENGQIKAEYYYDTNKAETPEQLLNPSFRIANTWDSTGKAEVIAGNGLFQKRNDTTGIVLKQGIVKDSLQHGTWIGFKNEDGQKFYEEEYVNGKLIKGTRWMENGQTVTYKDILVPASFPGGDPGLEKFLSHNIKYPKAALKQNLTGTPIVQFILDTTGIPKNVIVKTSVVHASLIEESIRVVKMMPAWTPQIERGLPTSSLISLPIRFTIQ
jgi:TonB family protein